MGLAIQRSHPLLAFIVAVAIIVFITVLSRMGIYLRNVVHVFPLALSVLVLAYAYHNTEAHTATNQHESEQHPNYDSVINKQ